MMEIFHRANVEVCGGGSRDFELRFYLSLKDTRRVRNGSFPRTRSSHKHVVLKLLWQPNAA